MAAEIEQPIKPENVENVDKYWSDEEEDLESIPSVNLIVTTPAQLINRFSSLLDLYMRTSDKHIKRVYNLIKRSKICGSKHH